MKSLHLYVRTKEAYEKMIRMGEKSMELGTIQVIYELKWNIL